MGKGRLREYQAGSRNILLLVIMLHYTAMGNDVVLTWEYMFRSVLSYHIILYNRYQYNENDNYDRYY